MAKGLVGAVPSARYALGVIRTVNGAGTLLATRQFGKRLGVDVDAHPALYYAFRLFGIRTVYSGAELIFGRGQHLQNAVAIAPIFHVSDTITAVTALRKGHLPKKSAQVAVAISAVNVVLSLLAWRRPKRRVFGLPWQK